MNRGFNPQSLNRTDNHRLKRYHEMLAFYAGRQWPGRPGRNEKRLTFNYVRVVVDKLTSYLMNGLNVRLVGGGGNATPALLKKANEALVQVHKYNNLDVLDYETEVDTAILGDGCYKLTWDTTQKQVKVSAPDMQGVFCWWRGDDTSQIRKVALRYYLGEEEVRELYPKVIVSKEATLVEVWTNDHFEL